MNESIIKNLTSNGTYHIFKGIITCVNENKNSQEVKDILISLKEDNRIIAGYQISQFSIAAMDILNLCEYHGNDTDIKVLIESKLDFI